MSHLSKLVPNITESDLKFITSACKKLGANFVRGAKSYQWYNQTSKCDHKITSPLASYEIGLKKGNSGTYELLFDEYSPGGITKAFGSGCGKLLQRVSADKAKYLATVNGYNVSETTDKRTGEIVMRLTT